MSSVQPSFYFDQPTNTVDALRRSIAHRLVYAIGKDVRAATSRDWLFAILYAVRDRIMDSWRESVNTAQEQDAKRVYYLSMEFLTGRMLTNALMAIGIYDDTKIACAQLGADFVPRIDEGDIVVAARRIPSISKSEARRLDLATERVLKRFPEVARARLVVSGAMANDRMT